MENIFWSYETQVNVVLTCCIVHNHIIRVGSYEFFMKEICSGNKLIRQTTNLSQREESEENNRE
jgi:hypothetical protein